MSKKPSFTSPNRARKNAVQRATLREARRALVLQGGSALGAYQAGVYAAAAQEGMRPPDWVAGVSIGAINAALIAGNPPHERVGRLREFWELVSSGPAQRLPPWLATRETLNQWSACMAALVGVPGFFEPRRTPALLMGSAAPLTSLYDTSPLKSTLERLVDFDRLNDGGIRVSVGAVNVRSGNSVYFDTRSQHLGPEHIMASAALPPGFPPVTINDEDYWDGGIVSNTPLQYVLDQHPRTEPLVVLQVDLFSARGPMPTSLSEVIERQKDIIFSSRTRMNTDVMAANLNLQQAFADLIAKLPPLMRQDASVSQMQAMLTHQPIGVYHLIHQSKDSEFSRVAVKDHWDAGMRGMRRVLSHSKRMLNLPMMNGVTTYDLSEEELVRRVKPRRAASTDAVHAVPPSGRPANA